MEYLLTLISQTLSQNILQSLSFLHLIPLIRDSIMVTTRIIDNDPEHLLIVEKSSATFAVFSTSLIKVWSDISTVLYIIKGIIKAECCC